MHDLRTERFLQARNDQLRDGGRGRQHQDLRVARRQGHPPYLHDQRLTFDDIVEFFNLVLGDKLTAQEKQDLVAFMRAL
jgi:hypothetical protein